MKLILTTKEDLVETQVEIQEEVLVVQKKNYSHLK
jgi:hypothetical protein